MFELAKNEIKRYQKWAWLWALLILALHILIMRFRPFLEPSSEEGALNNLLLMGGSFLFGLVQMALHKRKNHWTFLIHRPLSPVKIFFALFLAGACIIFIAAAMPWILTVFGLDLFGKGIVEMRHYAYIVFMTLACIMVYQIAILVVTNASWAMCLFAVLLVVVLAPKSNSISSQFLPVIMFNLVLFYLNCKSFKPDLSTFLRSPLQQMLMAIPISFAAVYILVMTTTVYYHLPKFALGTHPDNNPVEDSFRYMYTLKESDYFQYNLSGPNRVVDEAALATSIIEQADLAEVTFFYITKRNNPWQHQLHVDDYSYEIINTENEKHFQKSWQFSHNNMLLVAHHRITGELNGVIGKNGFVEDLSSVSDADRFDEVPYLYRNQYLVFSNKILSIDFKQETLIEKYTLLEGESFSFAPIFSSNANLVYAFTNKRILLFNTAAFSYEYADLEHSFAAELPVELDNLGGAMVGELADGYVLMFYGRDYFGRDKAGSSVYFLGFDDDPILVGSHRFMQNSHPYWIEQFDFMVSPLLSIIRNQLFHTLDPANFSEIDIKDMKVNMQAVVLHIIAVLMALILFRFHQMSMANKLVWISFIVLTSVPGLISFILLHPFKGIYTLSALRHSPVDTQAINNV